MGLVVDRHFVVEDLRLVVAAAPYEQSRHTVLTGRNSRHELKELKNILFPGEKRRVFELFDIHGNIPCRTDREQRFAGSNRHRVDGHGPENAICRHVGTGKCRDQEGENYNKRSIHNSEVWQ